MVAIGRAKAPLPHKLKWHSSPSPNIMSLSFSYWYSLWQMIFRIRVHMLSHSLAEFRALLPLRPLGLHNQFPKHFSVKWVVKSAQHFSQNNPWNSFLWSKIWIVKSHLWNCLTLCWLLYENCHATTANHWITTEFVKRAQEISQSTSPRVFLWNQTRNHSLTNSPK